MDALGQDHAPEQDSRPFAFAYDHKARHTSASRAEDREDQYQRPTTPPLARPRKKARSKTTTARMPNSGVEITGEPNQVIKQPLKRNQACLQCRKRKLKCDAIRPHCTTCQKSHAHAIRTNSIINPVLICDFEDGGEDETGAELEVGRNVVRVNSGSGARQDGGSGMGRRKHTGQSGSSGRSHAQMDTAESRRLYPQDGRSSSEGLEHYQYPDQYESPQSESVSPEAYSARHPAGSQSRPYVPAEPINQGRSSYDVRVPQASKRKRRTDDTGHPGNFERGQSNGNGTDQARNAEDGSVREEISELKKIIRDMQERMLAQGGAIAGGANGSDFISSSAQADDFPPHLARPHVSGKQQYTSGLVPPPPPLVHHSSSSASSAATGYAGQSTYPPAQTWPGIPQPLPQGQSSFPTGLRDTFGTGSPAHQPASPNFLEMLSSAAAIESDKTRPSTRTGVAETWGGVPGSGSGSGSGSASSANDASPADNSGFSAESPNTFLRNAFPSVNGQPTGMTPGVMTPGFFSSGILAGMSPLGKGTNVVQAEWESFDSTQVQYGLAGQTYGVGVNSGLHVEASFDVGGEEEDVGMITDQVLMDILWPGWPRNLPDPSLMSHIVDMFFEHVPLVNRIFDVDTFRARMALPPTHHNFPRSSILHAMCAATARYTARVYTVPAESEPWRRTTEYNENPELEPDFGMRHATYAEKAIRECVDKAADLYEAAQASILLCTHYHTYSRWLHAWASSGFLNRLVVPLGICDGNRRLVSMLSKPSLLGDWKNDIEREERRNLCWAAVSVDVTSSAVGGWAGTIMLEEVTTPIPSMVIPTNVGKVFVESDQCIQTPDLFKRHPIKTGFNMYMKCIVLVSRINRFTRTWRSRHHTLSPEEGRSSREFADLDSMIGTFVMTFPPELRDPMTPDPGDATGRAFNLELFMAQILLHQGTICLHEMFADVGNQRDISTQRLIASARGILKMIYLLNATSIDVSLVVTAGFGFYTAARTLLLFLDHALETGSLADGGAIVLRSEIEVIRGVFDAYGERFPIGRRHSGILSAMLDACDAKYGSPNAAADFNFTKGYGPPISTTNGGSPGQQPGRIDDVMATAGKSLALTQSPYAQAGGQAKTAVPLTDFLNQRRGYVNTVQQGDQNFVDKHLEQQVSQLMNRKDPEKRRYYTQPRNS